MKDGIELPAPTSAPLYVALGLALLFAGLVTHPLVSAVGAALAGVGGVGWWREVLPRERTLQVPLQPGAERSREIAPRPRAVAHLVAGRDTHRMRLPLEVRPLTAGLRGGVAGSLSMAIVAGGYGLAAHGSPWFPINLLAGSVLPGLAEADLAELARFDARAFAVASAMHAAISLLVGLVYGALLPMLPGRPLLWGGIVAPLVWTAAMGSVMEIFDPALARHVSWPWFVASQVAFGMAAGAVVSRVEPVRTLQALPLVERAGIEGAGASTPREEPE